MSEENLLLTQSGGIATLTVNRPEVRNAVTHAMWIRLRELVEEVGRDPGVRVLVVRGAGEKAFASGADILEFGKTKATPEVAQASFRGVVDACEAIGRIPQPVIAMVNGHAIGAGCHLLTACDFRVAVDSARIGVPSAKLNITISHRHVRRLVQLVGPGLTREMLVTGRLLTAAEALAARLVEHVVPADQLASFTADLAAQVVASAPMAVEWGKAAVARVLDDPTLAGVGDDAVQATRCFQTEDFWEGVRAFQEKRAPRFTGR